MLCPDVVSSASVEAANLAAFGGRAYDYWEAPAGQTSRFAAFTLEPTDGGAWNAHLWAGTSASGCSPATQPADLGTARFGPGRPYGSEPRFKSDGSRFVVFDDRWRIVTYPGDGATAATGATHVVATYSVPPLGSSVLDPSGAEGANGYFVEPPRVAWTATGLAWAQPTQDGWEIVTAPDMTNALQSTYLVCAGVTPREIAMLDDGTVLASYRDSPQSAENLFLLKPDAQRNCVHEQQYTHVAGGSSSIATDFAVSPDGTLIAFLQLDAATQDTSPWMTAGGQLPGGYLYVVPVAGGTPVKVLNDPALFGPRWVAGGTGLVFTRLDGVAPASGREATSVVYVMPDGGSKHTVVQGDGVSSFVSTSGNAACSIGRGSLGSRAPGGGFGIAIGIAATGWAVRRRTRPASRRATG
ncbi:MAG: hypothetical protein JOZ69_15840 [Myxococcales bacterium]|nr:hypothetical protein [Myxococcales bacterium]